MNEEGNNHIIKNAMLWGVGAGIIVGGSLAFELLFSERWLLGTTILGCMVVIALIVTLVNKYRERNMNKNIAAINNEHLEEEFVAKTFKDRAHASKQKTEHEKTKS